jgi:hypothetical protein
VTGDLAVWLRAQLDADEQTAQAALGHRWVGYPMRQSVEVAEGDQMGVKVVAAPTNFEHWEHRPDYAAGPQTFEHIARHDPAFTLADITAKRAIIDRHEPEQLFAPGGPCIVVCRLDDEAWPCPDLRLLAQPYAGRPGWHNEWSVT